LLPLLLVSRAGGPLLLTDRRAPAGVPAADRCPLTGRGRLSYRRAAELFTAATRELDPAGRGWTLRQLRHGGPPGRRLGEGPTAEV
jgi:integrase/recombinase XerD